MKVKKKVQLVAQEINLAKILASNDKRTRDRGVRKLAKWLAARGQAGVNFSEDDMMRVWKGLFYCMWMADKPLVQEDMAENISQLVHAGGDDKFVSLFVQAFLDTMAREWLGIDHYRLDKFLMLARRVMRQALAWCARVQWRESAVDALCDVLARTVLSSWSARGLTLHVCELLHVELAKSGRGRLAPETVHRLLRPFVAYLGREREQHLRAHVVEHVFHHLMRQSELGQDCEARLEAWRQAGFPGSSWKQMELVEEDEEEEEKGGEEEEEGEMNEEEEEDTVADPRAGSVHVELKPLAFEPAVVADMLLQQRASTFEVPNRRTLKELADDFGKMAEGNYPQKLLNLGQMSKYVREVRTCFRRRHRTRKGAKKLMQFEKQLKQRGADVANKSEKKQAVGTTPAKQRKKRSGKQTVS